MDVTRERRRRRRNLFGKEMKEMLLGIILSNTRLTDALKILDLRGGNGKEEGENEKRRHLKK